MAKDKNDIEFSITAQKELKAIERGLKKVSERLIAEEKARGGYLIISDKNGNIKKVSAKDL